MPKSQSICLPLSLYKDHRVKGSHLRIMAAIVECGQGELTMAEVSSSCGIDYRACQRGINDLDVFGHLSVVRCRGSRSSYKILNLNDSYLAKDTLTVKTTAMAVITPTVETTTTPSQEYPAPLFPPSFPPEPPKPTPYNPPPTLSVARGTRLGLDGPIPDEFRAYADGIGLDRVDREWEDFRDYWHSKAGKEAIKLNWFRTWQRWARTALDRQPNGRSSKSNGVNGHGRAEEAQQADEAEAQRSANRLAIVLARQAERAERHIRTDS